MNRARILKSAALLVGVYLTSAGLAWSEVVAPVAQPAKPVAKASDKTKPTAKADKKAKEAKASAVVVANSVQASEAPQTRPLAPRETTIAAIPVDLGKPKAQTLAAREAPVAAQVPAPPKTNPYLGTPYLTNAAPAQQAPYSNTTTVTNPLKGLADLLPSRGEGSSLLPSITTVYPTGEKPLKVVTFKCPTEMLGVQPPPMKLLHEAVNLGMEGINRTNLLSFNLQQVCQ